MVVKWHGVALLEARMHRIGRSPPREPPDTIMVHMSTREHTIIEAILAESVECWCMVV
jgi:hypothetical protein